jgi:hypothetical protein
MNAMMKHVALMLAVSLPLAARAQEDFAPAKAAIDSLKQLPASVARVQQVIQGTSYGPFEISGSCGYDKQWYCLGMACKTFNWWWKFPNYTWFKDSLSSRYGQVSSTSGQFDTSFAPVRNWMKTSLPQFSQQLDRENVILTTAEQVVMNPASAPEAVARAKADIAASLNRILAGLQPGVQQLNEGISSLSNFNSQLNQTLNGVNDLRSSLDQVVASDKASMDKKLGDYPCGDDDARSKYQEVENMVTGQFQNVQSAAQSFGVTSNQTDTAVSLILGTVLTLQTRYQGIAQALNRAQISPAGAVQQLRIDVVSAAWRDFAQYAETQFP